MRRWTRRFPVFRTGCHPAIPSLRSRRTCPNPSSAGSKVVGRLIIALLANGNVLMEGLPSLAKTRAVKSLSQLVESDFRRIQFTPGLSPADATGSEIYFEEAGKGTFKFQQGPISAHLDLADEINRATANKVQAALLEATEERQVTDAGTTWGVEPHRRKEKRRVCLFLKPRQNSMKTFSACVDSWHSETGGHSRDTRDQLVSVDVARVCAWP